MPEPGSTKERFGKSLEGSHTIEAALLMPFLLAIFLLCLETSFYLHDRMLMEKAAEIGALRGSLQKQISDSELSDTVRGECIDLIKNKLLGVREVEIEIRVTAKQVEVTMKGNVWMPLFGGVTAWFDKPAFHICAAGSAARLEQVRFIRNVKRVRRLSEQLLPEGAGNSGSMQSGYDLE